MKTMRWLTAMILLLLFCPLLNAATIDLTEFEWDFDAGLYAGPVVVAGDLEGSTLLFDTQTEVVGGYELQGVINWVLNGSPASSSTVFGVYDGDNSIAFLLNTPSVWALFEGTVDSIAGNYMVGTLSGLFQEEFNGYWTATRGDERLAVIPVPKSMALFVSALGGLVLVGRVASG